MEKNKVDMINSEIFEGFEKIKMGIALEVISSYDESNGLVKNLLKIVRELFLFRYKLYINTTNNANDRLFLYSTEYSERKDYWEWYENLINKFDEYYLLIGSNQIQIPQISLSKYIYKWLISLRRANLTFNQSLFYLPKLIEAFKLLDFIKKRKLNIKVCTVLCDFKTIDNILIQFYNLQNISTVSLQHGIYASTKPISMKNSLSKYLLIHGKYTELQCLKCGKNIENTVIVGMPQLIESSINNTILFKDKIKKIGIIFDGSDYKDNDIEMLKVLSEYAKKYNLRLNIKFHPGYGFNKYDFKNLNIDEMHFFEGEVNIKDFFHSSDIIICSASTVFIECLLIMKPVLLYKFIQKTPFDELEWFKFKDDIELEISIKKLIKNPKLFEKKMLKIREFFTLTKNIDKRYIDFYSSLNKKDKEYCKLGRS